MTNTEQLKRDDRLMLNYVMTLACFGCLGAGELRVNDGELFDADITINE